MRLIASIIDDEKYPLETDGFRSLCKEQLAEEGVLVLQNFIKPQAIASILSDGLANQHLAFHTVSKHNIYLEPADPKYPSEHSRNREVTSSKGCITTDQITDNSVLHTLYNAKLFREFLCAVLGEDGLHEYGDDLSSINLHYAREGEELGWHYDNSTFAITLMIQSAESDGTFEYVKNVRDADNGEMNYVISSDVLDGKVPVKSLNLDAGDLVLFRGRDSMHRVTPVSGSLTRILAVLAYNTEPGISLSESARMTFYGRL